MTPASKAFHTYENVGFGEQVNQFNPMPQPQQQSSSVTTAVTALANNHGNGNGHTTTTQLSAGLESPFPDPIGNDSNSQPSSSNPNIVATTTDFGASLLSKAPGVTSAVSLVTKLIPTSNMQQKPIESFREWSISTFKCTKQLINEKRGKCSMTTDIQLEEDIQVLRDNQKKLIAMLNIAQAMTGHYTQIVNQQKQMQELMNEFSLKFYKTSQTITNTTNAHNKPNDRRILANFSSLGNNLSTTTESPIKSTTSTNDFSPILDHMKSINLNLTDEFKRNAISLNANAKNGDKLVTALMFFCSNLSTLIYKTIEDTLCTVKKFEAARLEYDAERNSVSYTLPTAQSTIIFSNEKLESARVRYEQLREDVQIKMKFLEENTKKVLHKQILLFNGAFSAYANGNTAALDTTLKNFSVI